MLPLRRAGTALLSPRPLSAGHPGASIEPVQSKIRLADRDAAAAARTRYLAIRRFFSAQVSSSTRPAVGREDTPRTESAVRKAWREDRVRGWRWSSSGAGRSQVPTRESKRASSAAPAGGVSGSTSEAGRSSANEPPDPDPGTTTPSTPTTPSSPSPAPHSRPLAPNPNHQGTPLNAHHQPDYPPFIRRLLARLPHAPASASSSGSSSGGPSGGLSSGQSPPHGQGTYHTPTKEDLLRLSTSVWQRLKIRFKWFSIRGWRRFNTDDMSAFLSWFLVGNTLWIIIGTTTFVSAVFATLNSLSLQSYVAKAISDYLTQNTGFSVIFESAIVPRWGASTITFRNVYVSRHPTEDDDDEEDDSRDAESPSVPQLHMVSPDDAAAYTLARQSAMSLRPTRDEPPPLATTAPPSAAEIARAERAERLRKANNYTMFDVNFEEVDVTLSLVRWLGGKGLVKEAKIRGVRGVIDRRHVWWDYSVPLVPADFRHKTHVGDFEFESLQVEDFLVTVYQPGGQRPFNVSIFNATVGPFRKRWMFYDLMSADGITGQYDNCLFSLHMPQKLGKAKEKDDRVKRMARFRIDGLPIEHAQYATGFTGPISWITSGKLDAVLDIKFPTHPDDEVDINALLSQISKNVQDIARETGVMTRNGELKTAEGADARAAAEAAQAAMEEQLARTQKENEVNPGQHRLAKPALRAPYSPASTSRSVSVPQVEGAEDEPPREVTVDIDLRFRDLKAAVPIYTTDLSVRNNALIRPIVAFINANRTLVPIHCTVKSPLSDFDGSWTLFETGLTSSISQQMYAALAHHVSSAAANSQRIRTVSAWGIQRGAEAVLHTLRTVVDPVHSQAQGMTGG